MKKSILFLALTLTAGLWAETINDVMYLDATGVEQTANNVNVVTSSSEVVTWGAVGQETWYVVLAASVWRALPQDMGSPKSFARMGRGEATKPPMCQAHSLVRFASTKRSGVSF